MEARTSSLPDSQQSSQTPNRSNAESTNVPDDASVASISPSASPIPAPVEEHLNHSNQSSAPVPESSSNSDDPRPKAPTRASTASESKKCWICYSDSTEDDSLTSPWRSPCPCALTAHEACLLDWIADLENPKNKNQRNGRIECPQCKSEIKIARPKSYVVRGLQILDNFASRAILPGLASVLVGTTWAGLWWHGLGSLYIVFGSDASTEILQRATEHKWWSPAGLPLIPVSLIASRTKYSKLVCPFATLFLLAARTTDTFIFDTEIWPPTAPGTFACLPVVQSAYSFVYKRAFGDLNRKWLAEVQPRAQENHDQEDDNEADGPQVEPGDVVVDLNIEFELGGRLGNEDNRLPGEPAGAENAERIAHAADPLFAQHDPTLDDALPPPNEPMLPPQAEINLRDTDEPARPPIPEQRAFQDADLNARPNLARADAPEHGPNDEQAGANGNDNDHGNNGLLQRRGEDLVLDSTSIAQTILGALVFPVVSRGMGQFLLYTLPSTLTNETAKVARPGLLQTRWGRTVVGGALFVVLKDVVKTYARWRVVKGHRQRRVVDFNPTDTGDRRGEKK